MTVLTVISVLHALLLLCVYQVTDSIRVRSGDPNQPCEGVEVVSREEWKAREPWTRKRLKLPLNKVIIIHTGTSHQCYTKQQCVRRMQFTQQYSMDDKDWRDIAFNFLIGGDGRAYEGTSWFRPGAHTVSFNTNSIGIAFVGNFTNVTPSQKMVDAAFNLIECGVQKGYLTPTHEIHGQKDVVCTESPGDKLYAIIRKWKNYKGGRMPLYNC